MITQRIEQIDETLIQQLCADNRPESQTLEFKRELPAKTPDGRAELAKDVCALANADGGDIIYGVGDANACASKPIPITGEPSDAAKRRIQEILEARIEPRVLGLQLHHFDLGTGYGLAVRVPASFNGPHRYGDDEHRTRFVVRSGTRITELTYPELRGAFDRSATLFERARQFRAERLGAIVAGRTPRPLVQGSPLAVCHLIPLMAMDGRSRIDVAGPLYHEHPQYTRFRDQDWGNAYSRAVNLDGMVVYTGGPADKVAEAYVQIFRSGAFESVRCIASEDEARQSVMWASAVCWFVRDAADKLLSAARDFGIVGPAAFSVAILSIGSHRLRKQYAQMSTRLAADRPDLVMPDRLIERLEEVKDPDEVARPALDLVYQCFGLPVCEAYDANGKWRLPARWD